MPWYYHLNLKDGLPFHPYFSIPLQLYLGYSNNSQWHRNLFWQQTFEVIFDITQFLSRIHIGIWRIWFFCFWIWMGSDPLIWINFPLFCFDAQLAGWLSTLDCSVQGRPMQSGPRLWSESRESQLLSWIWLVDIVDSKDNCWVDSQSQSPPRRHI